MCGNVPKFTGIPVRQGELLLAQEGRVPRWGQKRTSGRGAWMSTPPSTADICQGEGYFRFVPLAEVVRLQRDLFQKLFIAAHDLRSDCSLYSVPARKDPSAAGFVKAWWVLP